MGIPVAPSYRLSGLTLVEFQPSAFSYLVRKFCCQYCFIFWFRQCFNHVLISVPVYRMPSANMPPPENPLLGEALTAVAQGTAAILQMLQNQTAQRSDRPQYTTLQQFLAINPPGSPRLETRWKRMIGSQRSRSTSMQTPSDQSITSPSPPSSFRVQQPAGTIPTRPTRAMLSSRGQISPQTSEQHIFRVA